MVVERSATNQNYFFVNELSENSISFYKSRSLNISNSESYQITDIYPYVEWQIRPAAGASYITLSADPAGDIKTTLEALLSIADRDAYITVTSVAGNATLVKLHLPATSTNRSLNYIKSLFVSNTGPTVRINNLSSTHRLLLDNNITTSFLTGRTFSLAVLSGNSFEENFNVAELETYETSKTFTLSVLGEVESTISWVTASDLGSMVAGRVSNLSITAVTSLVDSTLKYNLVSGKLPYGMRLSQYGELVGSPRQYASNDGLGLIYFDNNINTTFDNGATTFDRKYTFTVMARDRFGFSASTKTFTINVVDEDLNKYSNIYMKPFLVPAQRALYENFINNSRVFAPEYIY